MIERIKNLIVSPKSEWKLIENEEHPHGTVFINYVLPLSLIPAIAAFIGYGLIGYSFFGVQIHIIGWGIKQALVQWSSIVLGIYFTAIIINSLANKFDAKNNFNKAFALVAYSYLPFCLGGVFYILPFLSWLALITGIYSLYLLYIGMQPLMKTPKEKNVVYYVVSLLTMIVITSVVMTLMRKILLLY